MENQKSGPGLACYQDFAKEKELEPKVKIFSKLSKLEDVMSKFFNPNESQTGVWGPTVGRFFYNFLRKK